MFIYSLTFNDSFGLYHYDKQQYKDKVHIWAVKRFFFHIAGLTGIPSVTRLAKITDQRLVLPMYHIVSDKEVIHIKHIYKFRNVKAFENDIDFLLRNYHPISLNELVDLNQKGIKPAKPSFVLTFDDALSEIYENAVPLLLKKGIPALIFVNPGFIDNRDMFYRYKISVLKEVLCTKHISGPEEKLLTTLINEKKHTFDKKGKFLLTLTYNDRILIDQLANVVNVDFNEYLRVHKPYMSSAQLNDLSDKGFSIGAHSMDHPGYTDISIDDQLAQTISSNEYVSRHFKQKYRLFAFPFTDTGIPARFFNIISNGKQPYADLTFGTSGIKNDRVRFNLQRIPMEKGTFEAEEVLRGEYLYYLFKAPFGKNLIRRS